MPGLTLRRGIVGQRAEGVDEVEQQSLLGQRIVAMPQAINQLANLSGTQGILADHLAEPPVAHPGDGFQTVRLQINHPVAPAVSGFRFAGMQLVGIHGDNGVRGGDMLAAAVAKAFSALLNHADAEGFVGMGFKGVARDMGVVKLHPGQLFEMAKARAVFFITKLGWYALHACLPTVIPSI